MEAKFIIEEIHRAILEKNFITKFEIDKLADYFYVLKALRFHIAANCTTRVFISAEDNQKYVNIMVAFATLTNERNRGSVLELINRINGNTELGKFVIDSSDNIVLLHSYKIRGNSFNPYDVIEDMMELLFNVQFEFENFEGFASIYDF